MTHHVNLLVMLALLFLYAGLRLPIFAAYLLLTALMVLAQARYMPLHESSAGNGSGVIANLALAIVEIAIAVSCMATAIAWESWRPIIFLYVLLATRLGFLFLQGVGWRTNAHR